MGYSHSPEIEGGRGGMQYTLSTGLELLTPEATADFSCVRIFHESVWFVRAIGNRPNLWHAQTIRFRRNVRKQLKSAVHITSSPDHGYTLVFIIL